MNLKNTREKYGSVAKWLHWVTAICFLFAYVSVYYSHFFIEPRTPDERFVRGLHTMFGISAGLLFLPRLLWRFTNQQPEEVHGPAWQELAAKVAHWALYAVILAMPLTGWLGYGGGSVNFFWLFDIPTFRNTGLYDWFVVGILDMDFETFEGPIDYFHKKIMGKWLASILILVHIGAALYHHFHLKDNTLKKMIPGGKVDM